MGKLRAYFDGKEVFQSLVGTLKTRYRGRYHHAQRPVSIPRRYAKNEEDRKKVAKIAGVSIPRRYAKNGNGDLILGKYKTVSIPRRYAKNHES